MSALPVKKWTREEYERLVEADFLGADRRYELVDGQIVEIMTHKPPHATAMTLIDARVRSILAPHQFMRTQLPIALDDLSEPEPDIAIVRGRIADFASRHPGPTDIELIVEVSDSSLDRDRKFKAPLYSRAGIPELWIVDLTARKLEMHRDPAPSGYRTVTILAETETAAPLFAPGAAVLITDLLPKPEP